MNPQTLPRVLGKKVCAGEGPFEPLFQTLPPFPRGLKRQAARKGLGGARNTGLGVPPPPYITSKRSPRRAAHF